DELVVTVPWEAVRARADVPFPESPVITTFANPATEAGHYARALARLAGRATRADHPVPPEDRTVLDLVAVLAAGRGAARATAPATGQTMTVAETAARCGFTSAAYFSHAFRRHFGSNASDIRRPAAGGSF